MKEVSCKVLDVFFRSLRKRGISPDALIANVQYPLSHLQNKHERIEWAVYAQIMRNAGRLWNADELVALGGAGLRSPLVRPLAVIGRLLFRVGEFYRWTATEGSGLGNQLYTCIKPSYQEPEPHRIVIDLLVADGCELSPEFFTFTKGGYVDMPRLLGLRSAQVDMTMLPNGARYDIRYPKGGGALAWLRKAITWPFTVRSAARELKDANEALQTRYEELEQARDKLALQAAQLTTAHAIGELIHRDLNLERTLTAVARALVDVAAFEGAEVLVSTDTDGNALHAYAREGAAPPPETGERLTLRMESRGRPLGSIGLWPTPKPDRRELLTSILPTISMAVDNAVTHRALVDYRENLEKRVTERTAELQKARDTLAETVQHLQEAQQARDRIFANINHEIRTPLSLIMLTVADLISRGGGKLEPRMRSQLGGIDTGARKLLRLVDEMLLLAAVQEHKLTLDLTSCDLGAMMSDLVTQWTPAADAQELMLSYQGPTRLCAQIDEQKLERVVANLLSNAFKFTPRGGSVQVELTEAAGTITIAVRDTGIGIDDEFRQRIFGRFEQGRPALHPSARGSGLGLSLAKELVEAHGGRITVDNPRAGGSIFRVTLPSEHTGDARPKTPVSSTQKIARVRALRPQDYGLAAGGAPADARALEIVPAGSVPATILVAEDDPDLCDAIARTLGEQYRVLTASDGITALRLAQSQLPDLLVSDVGMPGLDGLELTRRFRELPGNRLAPVLLLTAYANLADRLSGFRAGAIDYIVKPFDPDELRARVRSQLQMRALALQLHQSEKLAALGTLSAGLAHEMRNPANAIVNAVEPLVELLPPDLLKNDSPIAQLIEVLRECSGQIAILARQLLGFKRPGDLERQDVPWNDLLARALGLTQRTLRPVELRQEGAYAGTVRCAAPLMVQVLTNLLDNAAYAAGQGGWVRVATRLSGDKLIVEVGDSGPGVPRDLRERIFEPFFTTKPPGAGNGLGLTTSREIAERHGGLLDVRDLPLGSVFHLEIPIAPVAVAVRVAQTGAAS